VPEIFWIGWQSIEIHRIVVLLATAGSGA